MSGFAQVLLFSKAELISLFSNANSLPKGSADRTTRSERRERHPLFMVRLQVNFVQSIISATRIKVVSYSSYACY